MAFSTKGRTSESGASDAFKHSTAILSHPTSTVALIMTMNGVSGPWFFSFFSQYVFFSFTFITMLMSNNPTSSILSL